MPRKFLTEALKNRRWSLDICLLTGKSFQKPNCSVVNFQFVRFNLVSFHLGLANGIILSLLKIGVGNPPNVIEIIISVDGLPAYQLQKAIEASFGLFWPEHVVKMAPALCFKKSVVLSQFLQKSSKV